MPSSWKMIPKTPPETITIHIIFEEYMALSLLMAYHHLMLYMPIYAQCIQGSSRTLRVLMGFDVITLTTNPSWSSDAIRLHKSVSTSLQVMACCLTAPSHYLNLYWLMVEGVFWYFSVNNPQEGLMNLIRNMCLEIKPLKLVPLDPGGNVLNIQPQN